MFVDVCGITVDVVKKNIKNMHLYVLPADGNVRVSAPLQLSEDTIKTFVCTNLEWIKKKQADFGAQPRQTKREYVSGETFYLWGKQYITKVVDSKGKANSLTFTSDRAVLAVRKDSNVEQRARFVEKYYRGEMKTHITKSLEKWHQKTGLKCNFWHVRKMTTRWGSCNTNSKSLVFNTMLAKQLPKCLDYVVLHELTHLLYPHHDKNFVAFMDKHSPYWRETQKELNDGILDYYAENR